MRRSDNRQDGGPVGLLPVPRERRNSVSQSIIFDAGPLDGLATWTLLASGYLGIDGRGSDIRTHRFLLNVIRRGTLTESDVSRAIFDLEAASLVAKLDTGYLPTAPVLAFLRARTFRRGVEHDFRDLLQLLNPSQEE